MKKIKETALKLEEKVKKIEKEVRKNIATAILAAFAFIIALVWRDAIQGIVNEIVARIGLDGTGYIYTIIIASIVTLICVLGIMFFSRWGEKK